MFYLENYSEFNNIVIKIMLININIFEKYLSENLKLLTCSLKFMRTLYVE